MTGQTGVVDPVRDDVVGRVTGGTEVGRGTFVRRTTGVSVVRFCIKSGTAKGRILTVTEGQQEL